MLNKKPTTLVMSIVFFDDKTLLTALQQAQASDKPINELLTDYYIILTASNEIYDDFGEVVSLEKIRNAVSLKKNLVQKNNDTSDEELMNFYLQQKDSIYTSSAALIKIQSDKENFNPQRFSVMSCGLFSKENKARSAQPQSREPTRAGCILS